KDTSVTVVSIHTATNKSSHTAQNTTTELNGNDQPVARQRIYMLSAPDEPSLAHEVQALLAYLEEKVEPNDEWMENLAYTLNECRPALLYRAIITADTVAKLKTRLSSRLKTHKMSLAPVIGFVFTGQGAQWPGMGKELLGLYPVFRRSMERANFYMRRLGAPCDMIDEIIKPNDTSRLSDPLLSQPICSALQVALVDLLASWRIYPNMEDAITVAYFRGVCATNLVERRTRGAMMAVGMSDSDAVPYLEALQTGKATVACVNSPLSITVSGDEGAIVELEANLRANKVFVQRLDIEAAYHSHHMDTIRGSYFDSIVHIRPLTAADIPVSRATRTVQFFSSVSGHEAAPSELGPAYWVENLAGQVKFVDAIRALCFGTRLPETQSATNGQISLTTLIEIGPHAALAGPISADPAYSSVLIRSMDAASSCLNVAASLAGTGHSVNFQAINSPVSPHKRQFLDELASNKTQTC
ncbi:acyl transferase/acyl hydrolase/lysophospholipase, partial [Aspergillus karnatakaensis]|uniref:acyltransferase domain-containing protein n=1 Tax=Aspergillus karnatakaensis TaxID=1810916 RepID=UPI003CCD7E47